MLHFMRNDRVLNIDIILLFDSRRLLILFRDPTILIQPRLLVEWHALLLVKYQASSLLFYLTLPINLHLPSTEIAYTGMIINRVLRDRADVGWYLLVIWTINGTLLNAMLQTSD